MSTNEKKPRRTFDQDFIDGAVKLVTQEALSRHAASSQRPRLPIHQRVIPGPTENIADHLLDDAKISVFKYIETFYNPVRLHQTLEYQSPDQFERKQKMPLVA